MANSTANEAKVEVGVGDVENQQLQDDAGDQQLPQAASPSKEQPVVTNVCIFAGDDEDDTAASLFSFDSYEKHPRIPLHVQNMMHEGNNINDDIDDPNNNSQITGNPIQKETTIENKISETHDPKYDDIFNEGNDDDIDDELRSSGSSVDADPPPTPHSTNPLFSNDENNNDENEGNQGNQDDEPMLILQNGNGGEGWSGEVADYGNDSSNVDDAVDGNGDGWSAEDFFEDDDIISFSKMPSQPLSMWPPPPPVTHHDPSTVEDSAAAHDVKLTPFTVFRYVASIFLLIFSIIIVGALIFTGNTRVATGTNPWVALIVCILAVIWLSMIEGQQASLVGLPPVDPCLYKDSHPVTYKNAALAFKGDNLDRYLMGRQFMVLLVVFVINQCAGPLDPTVDVLGLPDGVKLVFLDIGLGMIIFTCILGQLTTQVITSHCMIDFINNYFALFTLYTAMTVEFSGIMHSSYLIQNILSAASGKPIISNEPPREGFTFAFFWGRVIMSLAILGFCLAATLSALFSGQTMMAVKYPSIPDGVSVFLFFFSMAVVGMLEGMQIAFFAVAKLPADERGTSFFGKKTCELLFKGNGQNLPGFMIGRQLTVVFSFFLVASITGFNITPGEGNNIFGISDGAQTFMNYGFHGAVITTILASITWQLAAATFPIAFLNNPASYILLCIALFLEWTGLCSGAWVLARVMKTVTKIQYDEVYVGTPEDRLATNHADKEMTTAQDVGHLAGGGFAGHVCGSHDALEGLDIGTWSLGSDHSGL